MYNEYFKFHQTPFSIAPDPGFLYLSQRHREALAHLMYGLKTEGGFVLITGEVGTGKTTLIRSVIEQVPADLDVAFILNPRVSVEELLETVCDELHVPLPADQRRTAKLYIDRLNRHLLESHARGRSTVMVIDEAQHLPPNVLEQIRLLTNLETNDRKLLRIILVGQPELDALLERSDLRQLAQRITARCHLTALDRRETRAYVAHRLALAGGHPSLFTTGAVHELYRLSGGIPRIINILADRALLGAYVENTLKVTRRIVRNASREVRGEPRMPVRWIAAGAAAGLALTAGVWVWAWFGAEQQPDAWQAGSGAIDRRGERTGPGVDDTGVVIAAAEPSAPESGDEGEPDPFVIIGPGTDIRTTADWPESSAPDTDAADRIIRPGAGVVPRDTDTETEQDARPAQSIPRDAQAATAPRSPAPMVERDRPSPAAQAPQTAPAPTAGPAQAAAGAAGEPATFASAAATVIPRPAMSSYRSMLTAFEALFAHWQRPFEANDVPCNVAPTVGLQCLRRQGGWAELTRYNHAAVLEFRDLDDEPYYAAITGYDDATAQLQIGRRTIELSIADLNASWPGSYIMLWEMPPGYRGSVALGDQQPTVAWLRRQLAQLMAVNLDAAQPDQFDDALDQALREFQRSHGLLPDGIAGPATWIQITGKVLNVPLLDGRGQVVQGTGTTDAQVGDARSRAEG